MRILFRIFIIGVILSSISQRAECEETPKPASPAVVQAEVPAHVALLQQARKHKEVGDYGKAQPLYDKLLQDTTVPQAIRQQVIHEYEEINFHLLLSRQETSDSVIHTVVAGDSLYKIAKSGGMTVDLIKRINGLNKDTIYPDMKLKVPKGEFRLKVDKSENQIELFFNEKPVKRYAVATGENNNTPVGEFKIINKLTNPTWYKAGAVVPPDSPENVLGTRWLGFDIKGYGIHGTTDPESIGKQASAGCIRMRNQEVEELYSLVPTGTKVVVVD